jgi:beta-glucosidase
MPQPEQEAEEGFPFRDPELGLDERVRDLVSRLSLDEKLGMMPSRQIAVPRLGIPEFHIGGEAAHGYVTKDGPTTSFPQTIGLSCSWDAGLLKEIGSLIGDEARAYSRKRRGLGGLCLFAPTIDMERDPRWGRTEEGYGEDPALTGKLSAAYVSGLQGDHPFYLKAVATPKHFYANNNEARRASCSASIDPRTRREYYLAAFEPAVRRARAASLMTSYNAINGVPAMLHPDLAEVVKGDWGMEGFVVCDGGALPLLVSEHKRFPGLEEAAAASVTAGIDNFSDNAETVVKALRGAIDRGLVEEARIDRAIARTFRVRFRLGHFDPAGRDPYAAIDESVLWGPRPRELALEAARKSIVLLTNRPGGLPLDPGSLKSLAVLGPLADIAYRDWYSGISSYRVTPFQALCARLPGRELKLADGSDIVSFRAPGGKYVAAKAWYDADLAAHRDPGSGGEMFRRTQWGWGNDSFRSLATGCFISTDDKKLRSSADEVWGWFVKERFSLAQAGLPEEPNAVFLRTWKNDPVSFDAEGGLVVGPDDSGGRGDPIVMEKLRDGLQEAVQAAASSDAAIVFLGNHPLLNGKEEIDRPSIMLPPEQERLAAAAVRANPRTVVVIVGSYPYALGEWKDKAAAILYAPHGGQEAGNALADVILGAYDPAGRLSMTWYADESGLGDIMDYDIAGKGATYRYHRGRVLYPFGHGLGYSSFEYLGMELASDSIGPGGEVRVKARILNSGKRDGEEVVQLYASYPASAIKRPIKQLLDFQRIAIPAGAVAEAELALRARDLEAWDQGSRAWFLEGGEISLAVGASSGDLRLRKPLRVDGTAAPTRSPYRWIAADEFDEYAGLILTEGEGGSSRLRRASPESSAPAFLTFERFDFGEGGAGRFEASMSGSEGSELSLALGDGALIGTQGSVPITLPRGKARIELRFGGDLSLLRFRFLREGER